LDVAADTIGIAMTERKVYTIDLRQTEYTLNSRTCKNEFQLTSIAVTPDGQGYVAGSLSGVVSCQIGQNYTDLVVHKGQDQTSFFPSNSVKVSVEKRGAISGGGDGNVALMNLHSLRQPSLKPAVPSSKVPVTAVAIGKNRMYALAIGNDWSAGVDGAATAKKEVEVYIRPFAQQDFQ
jgi:hypothetical protein